MILHLHLDDPDQCHLDQFMQYQNLPLQSSYHDSFQGDSAPLLDQ